MCASAKTLTLTTIIGFLTNCICFADLSPWEIVSQSISNYDKDWEAALDLTYAEREVTTDATGRPKATEVSQVMVLQGTPYSRLIAKNGHPLSPEEALGENEKYQKAVTVRDLVRLRDHEYAEGRPNALEIGLRGRQPFEMRIEQRDVAA